MSTIELRSEAARRAREANPALKAEEAFFCWQLRVAETPIREIQRLAQERFGYPFPIGTVYNRIRMEIKTQREEREPEVSELRAIATEQISAIQRFLAEVGQEARERGQMKAAVDAGKASLEAVKLRAEMFGAMAPQVVETKSDVTMHADKHDEDLEKALDAADDYEEMVMAKMLDAANRT